MIGENGILTHCWWERKMMQPLLETSGHFLKKLNIGYQITLQFLP